jgi:hypothetical protein
MECRTLEYYDTSGNVVTKPKRKFDTLDLAIAFAKHINSKEHTIHNKLQSIINCKA